MKQSFLNDKTVGQILDIYKLFEKHSLEVNDVTGNTYVKGGEILKSE